MRTYISINYISRRVCAIIMKISSETIEQLVYIINEISGRTGQELVDYFNQLGFNHSYPQSVNEAGSKAKYTRSVLESVNGTARIDSIVVQAVHPRQYINLHVNINDIVNKLNEFLKFDDYEVIPSGKLYSIKYNKKQYSGLVKNLIFASDGPKPEIVLKDTLKYEIEVVANKNHILIYDEPITSDGLTWNDMANWWANYPNNNMSLQKRLKKSLDPNAEKFFYETYYSTYNPKSYLNLPILIPQVYLHYDPYTLKQLRSGKRIPRQRMDFLMLLPENEKVIIEIDGKEHYSKNNNSTPCAKTYAKMVSEDRKLRLQGYEIYRFGGYELMFNNPNEEAIATAVVTDFFDALFKKHQINLIPAPTIVSP
jgi:very-short-patch-repair endonuclease